MEPLFSLNRKKNNKQEVTLTETDNVTSYEAHVAETFNKYSKHNALCTHKLQ